jgi:SAM-dependent MidA family methyltransferase
MSAASTISPISPLARLLAQEITHGGPISFARFMEQALYHPDHGFYASGRARVGREGDFFTNVSVGPLFGRLLASLFLEMWERLGRPTPFTIVEQGANTGDFAADVFASLKGTELWASLEYRIVEPFEVLRRGQAGKLSGLGPVSWAESLEALPAFTGVHFSNELMDALPVHLVRYSGGAWRERLVDWQQSGSDATSLPPCQNGQFVFVDGPEETDAVRRLRQILPQAFEGYQTEVNLEALRWIDQVGPKLSRGYLLAIDYGYPREEFYLPERSSGTLTCYRAHQKSSEPLLQPGETDITAHVEFTSIIERAAGAGMDLAGFTDQHRFMVGLAKPLLETMSPKDLRAFRTLMHPAFMGSAFKVLGLRKGVEGALSGL